MKKRLIHGDKLGCEMSRGTGRRYIKSGNASEVTCLKCLHLIYVAKWAECQKDGIPAFPCKNDSTHSWFTCPACGSEHYHGVGDGHRGSHCHFNVFPKGYILTTQVTT